MSVWRGTSNSSASRGGGWREIDRRAAALGAQREEMATERKPFVRLQTSLHREPWTRDEKMTLCELMMFLGDRWARDRLTAKEACNATLTRHQLAAITGRSHLAPARSALRVLSERISLSISIEGEFTLISWPKFAETQELPSRGREFAIPTKAPPKPQSAPAPSQAKNTPSKTADAVPTARQKPSARRTPKPPDPEAPESVKRFTVAIGQSNENPDIPKPGTKRWGNWITVFDRLHRIGGWTWEQIFQVIAWLPTHERGDFRWGLVILSAANFREHFPRMYNEMIGGKGGGASTQREAENRQALERREAERVAKNQREEAEHKEYMKRREKMTPEEIEAERAERQAHRVSVMPRRLAH